MSDTEIENLFQYGRDAVEQIFFHIENKQTGAEIGVWDARFSKFVLNNYEVGNLHLIDPWIHEGNGNQMWNQENQEFMDRVYQSAIERVESEIDNNIVHVHRDFSENVYSEFDQNYFDWVYVDGNHELTSVLSDLVLYHPLLKRNGYFICDDYELDHKWWGSGVTNAVDHLREMGLLELIDRKRHTILLKKNEFD